MRYWTGVSGAEGSQEKDENIGDLLFDVCGYWESISYGKAMKNYYGPFNIGLQPIQNINLGFLSSSFKVSRLMHIGFQLSNS